MKNELKIINKLEPILEETIEDKFHIVIVNNELDEKKAKENIKFIREKKKDYSDKIKPYKSTLNKLHKMVTAKEKENISIFDNAISNQKNPIDEYNHKIFLKQQELKRKAEELARREEERLRKEEEERIRLEKEKIEQQDRDNLTFEEIEAQENELENLKQDEENIENISVIPDKVISKKNEVKKTYNYSIRDKESFIAWALKNNLNLLRIEPNLSEFNIWVKHSGNSDFDFIEKTEVFR